MAGSGLPRISARSEGVIDEGEERARAQRSWSGKEVWAEAILYVVLWFRGVERAGVQRRFSSLQADGDQAIQSIKLISTLFRFKTSRADTGLSKAPEISSYHPG